MPATRSTNGTTQRQLLAIRQRPGEREIDIYDDRFLIARPLLQVLRRAATSLLLVDEIDRADTSSRRCCSNSSSDFQITIPERGTVRAPSRRS